MEDKSQSGKAGQDPKCKCNNPDPLLCHECEESTGVCYCVCHERLKRRRAVMPDYDKKLEDWLS